MSIKITDIIACLKNIDEFVRFDGKTEETLDGFSSLFHYKPNTVTFVAVERTYINEINETNHCIKLIITKEEEPYNSAFQNQIWTKDPKRSFFEIIDKLFNDSVDEKITLMSSNPDEYKKWSRISPKAVIGNNVKIGTGCVIEGNVTIGDNCEIHHNVVIRRNTKIGNRCTIFSGTVIGERGFNYTLDDEGMPHMLEHYGGVLIEDDVHIGDNCCIIQGMLDDTIIRHGAKLNTMVHVAHNSIIGQNTKITLPCHICGSVVIGRNCHIAASMIRNQVTIGNGATLGLGAVVVKDVPDGITVVGVPAKPIEKKD